MSITATASTLQTPLLYDAVEGYVDYKGRPVDRSKSGGWSSASFIIGVEVAERLAYYGISSNLITYMTGELGQSTATAAENVNAWSGTVSLLPLFGAFVADCFLGRYLTVVVSSILYILGLGLLTLSVVLPSFDASDCTSVKTTPLHSNYFRVILFFFSLYLVALAQGGHKPCVQAFGADQFDGQHDEESKAKSSFFNWWYFALCIGALTSMLVLSYIQDNLNWGLGFGIPCVTMVFALAIFLLGTKTYRHSIKVENTSAFRRIGRVFVMAIGNWRASPPEIASNEEACGMLPHQSSEQFKFLNKALFTADGSKGSQIVCSLNEVEEAKSLLRLFPIWATCLVYGVVFAQSSTFFTKQGVTMNRSISASFNIPPASLQSFIGLAIVITIPFYDRVFVPIARTFTGKPSGITMLQRIGIGIFLSVLSMAIAAAVEMKRLRTAQEFGLFDKPNETVPMSIWWLVPQYALYGISEAFTIVGLQEFFYDQVPSELRSVGLSLYLSILGVGSFISSFIVSTIENATGGEGHDNWFADNLNHGHLDYFYLLLVVLSTVELVLYVYLAKGYKYNR